MGIRIYLSNDQLSLAQKCAQNLSGFKSVFRPVNIVTQTAGMNRWLSIFMAEQNGIFSNFNFQTPNGLVSQLFTLAGFRNSDLFDTERVRWLVYDILSAEEFASKFPEISNYYADDRIKQIQLATKVADLLDQYLVYRPDMIETWNAGKEYTFKKGDYIKHEAWQRYIWVALKNKMGEHGLDKVSLKNRLIEEFKDESFQNELSEKITGITLFGLSLLTEFHLEIIHYLSQVISVDLYFLNPAPGEFWYDNKDQNLIRYIERKTGQTREELFLHEGNTLLSSMGKAGQNSFSVFLNDSDFINSIIDDTSRVPETNTLLGHIQNEIFFNSSDDERKHIPMTKLTDGSISINSCFTQAREVEAIYNHLLHWFENDPELEARDVLVMVSDIDLYAPYIQAVFDLAPAQRYIPYSIADQSYVGSNNLFTLIESILDLNPDNFTAEAALQIAEQPMVATKFGFGDLNELADLVSESNIKTGINGSMDDHTHLVSWQFGLERILLSTAMQDEVPATGFDDKHFLMRGVEGARAILALQFYAFGQSLIKMVRDRKDYRTLSEWRGYVEEVLNSLVNLDLAEPEELHHFQIHLGKLDATDPHFNKTVSFDVFKNAFISSLFSNRRDGHFLTGRVTFSSMIPMRSIPFKNVAMLGLDRDRFPRQEDRLGFNLIDAQKRRSDRNVRDNDKYLFLEALLSARNQMYISFIGQDPIRNKTFQPSIVVDELVAYIARSTDLGLAKTKEILISDHGLHSYNLNESSGKTYLGAIEAYSGIKLDLDKQALQKEVVGQFDISDIAKLFKNPFQYYYHKVLGVSLQEQDQAQHHSEIFEANRLVMHQIKRLLVEDEDLDIMEMIDRGERTGILPLKNMAKIPVETAVENTKALRKTIRKLSTAQEPKQIQLKFDSPFGQIAAGIELHGQTLLIPHFDSSFSLEKKKIELTLLALLIDALNLDYEIVLIDLDGASSTFNQNRLEPNRASKRLNRIVELFQKGHKEILCYLPKVNTLIKSKKPVDAALKSILDETKTNPRKNWYDPYIKLELSKGYFERDLETKRDILLEIADIFNCYEN